jgi:hypothetical protein
LCSVPCLVWVLDTACSTILIVIPFISDMVLSCLQRLCIAGFRVYQKYFLTTWQCINSRSIQTITATGTVASFYFVQHCYINLVLDCSAMLYDIISPGSYKTNFMFGQYARGFTFRTTEHIMPVVFHYLW